MKKNWQMRTSILGVVLLASGLLGPRAARQDPTGKRLVIGASTVFDGNGRTLHDVRIVVEGSKIVAVENEVEHK